MKKRINRLIRSVKKLSLDALLIGAPDNIEYLTGFQAPGGYLLVTPGKIIYFTHYVYFEQAKKNPLWEVILAQTDMFSAIAKKARASGIRRLGFEAKRLTFLEYKKIKEEITSRNIGFLKTDDVVERLREVKTPDELRCIRRAVQITEEALGYARELMDSAHYSEKTLALEIERFMKLKGDTRTAFDPIVASGAHAAYPHAQSGPDKVFSRKLVLIDLGARCCGYCADLTRVFFLGKMPNYHIKKIYNIVKAAQEKAISKIRAGVRACDIDSAARNYIEKKGLGKSFGHGLGHGVGLCVHELPYLSPHARGVLRENMVVTVEPAVYLPGKLGIRLESMVLVKNKGAEVIDGNFYWKYKTR
ncbi:MAG: aminopeptidase P family protein [Candidatus Omnitrophica bacterium]|nr:aminopeptidase P family protein [Candidatus Omnitrophota bacterium]